MVTQPIFFVVDLLLPQVLSDIYLFRFNVKEKIEGRRKEITLGQARKMIGNEH
jgi:hypothetical protein